MPASTRHNWTSLGPRNISGRIRALACADPTVAGPTTWYAGSAGGGVWKSTDGGARWSALWHDQPCMEIAALAIAPSRPERVYAATGEAVPASHISVRSFGVFVSDDAGLTWTNHGADVPNPDSPRGFEAVAVDPADHQHCWAVGADGAFRTTNGGTNWTQLGAGTHYTDVAFAGTRLFLVVGTSTDGAGRVVRLTTPATATDAEISDVANASVVVPARPAHLTWPASGKIAVAPSRPATAYVRWAGEDGHHLGIFRSLNAANVNVGTIRWDRLPDDPAMAEEGQGGYDLVLAVHPTEPSVVVTGQQLYVFVSNNANAATVANVTWRRIMSWELRNQGLDGHLADFHHVVLAGNPVECWVAADAGIARSLDWRTGAAPIHRQRFLADPTRPIPPGAVRWDKRDHGIGGAQFYDITQHGSLPGIVAGGLQDNGTVLRPGGLTWQRIFGADGGHAVFDPDDPYRMYISWYAGLIALQFPALLDVLFPGSPTADRSVHVPPGRSRAPRRLAVRARDRAPPESGRPPAPRPQRPAVGHDRRSGRADARRAAGAVVRAAGLCTAAAAPTAAAPATPAAGSHRPDDRRHARCLAPRAAARPLRAPGAGRDPAPVAGAGAVRPRRGRHAGPHDQRHRVRRDVQRRQRRGRRRRDRGRRRAPRHGRRAAGRCRSARGPPHRLGDAERGPPRRPRPRRGGRGTPDHPRRQRARRSRRRTLPTGDQPWDLRRRRPRGGGACSASPARTSRPGGSTAT